MNRDEVLHILQTRRAYASYWEWKDQQSTEVSVLDSYCSTRAILGLPAFSQLERPPQDPPDFIGYFSDGTRQGIELTEFVSEEAIRRNSQIANHEERVYRHWTPEQVLTELNRIVLNKDRKHYGVPADTPIELVIHTDEFVVRYDQYAPVIKAHAFGPVSRLHTAVLLFSYDPDHQHCPLCELPLKRQNGSA